MTKQEATKHYNEFRYPFVLSHEGFPEQEPIVLTLTTADAAALTGFFEHTSPSMILEANHPEFLGWSIEEILAYA